ncbi:MAG: CAAX prenyl protease-related protein [Luteolibacter sp.]
MSQIKPTDPPQLTRAHVIPFAVFMGFQFLLMLVGYTGLEWKHPDAPWWRQEPAQWIYPLQAVAVFGVLVFYRKFYRFDWSAKWCVTGAIFGAVGIGIWLLPTTLFDHWKLTQNPGGLLEFLGVVQRKDGFDPHLFENPAAYWTSLTLRFFRAAVVVALMEEIFWRGFLMRFVLDWEGDYWKQPFGRAHWISYLVVTGLFVMAHGAADRPAALVYGSMTYLLCVWSKNLGACVVMHAVANFLMGVYIMAYGKYGLW